MAAERDPDPAAAAEAAVDPDRLLPGEDPESHLLEDVEHWIAVYSELLSTKAYVLSTLLDDQAGLEHEAASAELATDRVILSAEIERFRRRLDFWRGRERALRGR